MSTSADVSASTSSSSAAVPASPTTVAPSASVSIVRIALRTWGRSSAMMIRLVGVVDPFIMLPENPSILCDTQVRGQWTYPPAPYYLSDYYRFRNELFLWLCPGSGFRLLGRLPQEQRERRAEEARDCGDKHR